MKRKTAMFLAAMMAVSSLPAMAFAEETAADAAETTVEVTGGQISGEYNEDGSVAIYRGIPYAAAPVGDLRWKAPQEVEPWDGVRECTEWGASAIQAEQAPFMMWSTEFIIEDTGYSEDCLTLNVWTSTDSENEKKPVIVYIHGGGFTSGGSSCEVYDGEYVASQDVVYVSINYRVGILGFLATTALSEESEEGVSGNYALMDQIAALQWVHDNIEQFGGDPENVTIMGQSAGASSVNMLVASPKAAGLFSKAISMSYNDIDGTLATMEEKEAQGDELFQDMTLEEMRELSTDELLAMSWASGPCIDGVYLTENFAESLASGDANDVTLMSGFVTGDTGLFASLRTNGEGETDQAYYEAQVQEVFGEYADECLAAYPADDETAAAVIGEIQIDSMKALQNYVAQAHDLGSENPTYLYYFTHVMPGETDFGAFHTSDVPYFLNVFSDLRAEYWTEEDFALGQTMSSYLINFAKTGDPNGEGLIEWAPSEGGFTIFNLDTTCGELSLTEEQKQFFEDYYSSLEQRIEAAAE